MRLLGSKIGSNAYMDMVDMEEPDLVTIGNNFIGRFESVLCTSEIIEKSLVLRKVEIADDVCLGQRAILLPGAKIVRFLLFIYIGNVLFMLSSGGERRNNGRLVGRWDCKGGKGYFVVR